jgi:Domain of unknown function (DUF4962)/Heparinase II/III-like protein
MNTRSSLALVLLLVVACSAHKKAPSTGPTWTEQDGEFLGPKDHEGAQGPHPIDGLMTTLKSAPRPELVGKHPRVFVTEQEIADLAQRAKTTHRELWAPVLSNLRALREPPPPPPAEERRAQNAVGLAIAEAALAYKVEKDPRYLVAAKRYMDAAVSYEVWGYRYNKPDIDLAAGHLLYGLGWGYDLLYDDLTPVERTKYRDKLVRQADILYRHYAPKPGRTYSYSQNHLFIPIAGLGIAAYALHGEVPQAAEWAKLSRALMSRVLDTYSEDGYLYESFEYWVFSVPWLILWTEAHAHVTGEDLFDRPGFRNMHLYVAHSLLPDGKNVFDFGDTFSGSKTRTEKANDYPRTHPGGHLHSNYNVLYALARRFGSAETQGVALYLKNLGQGSFYDYLSLLWYDPKVPATPIASLPPWHYFADNGVVYFRTDWTEAATALAFKCGPPEGHAALAKLARYPDWHLEVGHAHPDANSFILFGKGQYLTGDSGYSGVPTSDQHNTVLVNGKGQAHAGLGHNAFAGIPYDRLDAITLSAVELGQGKLKLVGHAAAAYDPALGVELFDREVTLVSPTEVDIVDRLKTAAPSVFTSLVHSDDLIAQGPASFEIVRGRARLAVSLGSPAGARTEIEPNWLAAPGRPGSVSKGEREARGTRLLVSNASPVKETELVTHLKIYDVSSPKE